MAKVQAAQHEWQFRFFHPVIHCLDGDPIRGKPGAHLGSGSAETLSGSLALIGGANLRRRLPASCRCRVALMKASRVCSSGVNGGEDSFGTALMFGFMASALSE